MTESRWPFDDPPNVATITVRQIIDGSAPILLVKHDADDGCWQYLTGGVVDMADALVVSLQEIFERDPTVGELADLQPGWQAARERVGSPWRRGEQSGK